MSIRVLRYDAAGEPLAKPVQLPSGAWVLEGYATRAGVFPYRNADGTMRYELRHPDEVGPTAAQLALCALTHEHPREGLVTPANAGALQKGLVLESKWDAEAGRVPVRVLVTHQDLLEALANGKKELSCGYQCDVVPEEGEYLGERYTHRQKGIQYNHLAVVDAGRAGPECALRLDSDGNVVSSIDTQPPTNDAVTPQPESPPVSGQEQQPMEQEITINGVTYKVPKQVAEALMAERAAWEAKWKEAQAASSAQADKAAADMAGMAKEKEAMTAKMDSLGAEVERLKKLHADATDPGQMRERIAARLHLERLARPVLGDNYDYSTADDLRMKLDSLDKLLPKDSALREKAKAAAEKGNTTYVDALFDAEISRPHADTKDMVPAPSAPAPQPNVTALIAERQRQRAKA